LAQVIDLAWFLLGGVVCTSLAMPQASAGANAAVPPPSPNAGPAPPPPSENDVGIPAMGQLGCACIGTNSMQSTSCTYEWAPDSQCVTANVMNATYDYPANIGEQCQKHVEPGHSFCWDNVTGVELPLPDGDYEEGETRAPFCDAPWCYVDPCRCNTDFQLSTYFSDSGLAYSYMTCGAERDFSQAEIGLPTLGGDVDCSDLTSGTIQPAQAILPFAVLALMLIRSL